jgi:hypothetical protein
MLKIKRKKNTIPECTTVSDFAFELLNKLFYLRGGILNLVISASP